MGLLIGNFFNFFTELSARDMIMAGYYSLTFLLTWSFCRDKLIFGDAVFYKYISSMITCLCFLPKHMLRVLIRITLMQCVPLHMFS